MKKVIYTLFVSMFISCSPTLLKSSWKSNDFVGYKANNILIVGVTQNTTGRMKYEERLKNEFTKRGVKASQSALVFEESFMNAKQTVESIDKEVSKLIDKGYETVLVSAVTGVDEQATYSSGVPTTYIGVHRFGRRYYLYQDIYFRPGYYDSYKVYHIETSVYNLNQNKEKSLVWVGSYKLVDPNDIDSSVNKYVRAVVRSLEEENIIPKIKQ